MNHLFRALLSIALTMNFVMPAMGREGSFPVPDTVNPELQNMISAGLPKGWNRPPRTIAEWKKWIHSMAQLQKKRIPPCGKSWA